MALIFLMLFDDLNFEIFVNFGSFLAILFIFRKDIIKLVKSFFNYIFNKETRKTKSIKNDFNYCLMIIIGTISIRARLCRLNTRLEMRRILKQ